MYRYFSAIGILLLIVILGSVILSRIPLISEIELIQAMAGKLILLPMGLFIFFFPKNIYIASAFFIGSLLLIMSLGGSLI